MGILNTLFGIGSNSENLLNDLGKLLNRHSNIIMEDGINNKQDLHNSHITLYQNLEHLYLENTQSHIDREDIGLTVKAFEDAIRDLIEKYAPKLKAEIKDNEYNHTNDINSTMDSESYKSAQTDTIEINEDNLLYDDERTEFYRFKDIYNNIVNIYNDFIDDNNNETNIVNKKYMNYDRDFDSEYIKHEDDTYNHQTHYVEAEVSEEKPYIEEKNNNDFIEKVTYSTKDN